MKKFEKIIIPALLLISIYFIYIFYFAPKTGLGDFSEFDPNAHVQKEINVKLISSDGFDYTNSPGKVIFYVHDIRGKKVAVIAPAGLPEGIESAEKITLFGHLHQSTFEAVEVKLL